MNIGSSIGSRYEILERLGEGPFFVAYKARERSSQRVCTVKVVVPDLHEDEAFVGALSQARAALQALAHPNLARVYDIFRTGGVPVVVAEYVSGLNLRERLKRIGFYTPSVAVDYAVAICETLQFLHGLGLVHGDLRPENVLISPEGVVKLTDVGIAPAIAASEDAASRRLPFAVPYLAPEVTAQKVILPASDLYALGAMLFEMVTGTQPYPADTLDHVIERHREDPVPSPREINPGVPVALDGIIRRALQKTTTERYHAAADMLADLKRLRDGLRFGKPTSWRPEETAEAVQARPAPSKPEESKPPRRQVAPPAEEKPLREEPRVRRREDPNRLPPLLRSCLLWLTALVAALAFVGVGVWILSAPRSESAVFPDMVGMSIEDARKAAEKLKITLVEREDFNDKYDRGLVYRVDYEPGRTIKEGRSVLVWVSRGSRLVWVPDLRGLSLQEAKKKAEDAGLKLGTVDRRVHETAPFDTVISQNPRSGKRVDRDTSVNLVVSDGPADGEMSATAPAPAEGEERTWNVSHTVKRDGRGPRQVRIEYEDDLGAATAFDEIRDEGDVISLQIRATGDTLRLRIYYNDSVDPVVERTVRWKAP